MIITLFESEWHAYTTHDQIIESDWEDVAQALMFFHERESKEEAPMYLHRSLNEERKLDIFDAICDN